MSIQSLLFLYTSNEQLEFEIEFFYFLFFMEV